MVKAKIGLEIHGYLNTSEKLFCSCKAIHGAKLTKPNTNICPICTGQPGAKPMPPNKEAIDKIIQIALLLGCKVNEKIYWQRKHYNWPDLPKGYQDTISGAYSVPNGVDGNFLGIRIKECHLEEDPAAWNPETGEIDYNRSGLPLVEIVTEPDFETSEQVVDWLRKLIHTLSYVKALDKSAGIKCDVNVSLPSKKGARVEIKNVNSIKNIQKAIDYEVSRQEKEVPKKQETRAFSSGKTILMRLKENAEDYRFLTDPDLPVIKIDKKRIRKIKENLPETPLEKLDKLIKKYKIEKKYAEILVKDLAIAEFFENIIDKTEPSLAVRWVVIELRNVLNYNKKELEDVEISEKHFVELLDLIMNKKITELKAKEILRKWIPKSFSPSKEVSGKIVQDEDKISNLIDEVLRENKKAVEDYKNGEEKAINFLIGQVMRKTQNMADYSIVRSLLIKKLK